MKKGKGYQLMANIFIIRQITRPEAYDYSTPKKITKILLPVWT